MRILALNLNHRTLPSAVDVSLVEEIRKLGPGILVFNEYVDIGVAQRLREMLAIAGYAHQCVSDSHEYRPGRWHNQILIASKDSLTNPAVPWDGPDSMCGTNTLSVSSNGMRITGIRVPAYERAADWYAYWEWAKKGLEGDLAIGDFNADPSRPRKWDRVLMELQDAGGWTRPDIEGDWSYRGNNGSTSRVDHVLVRNGITVSSARYVPEPFVGNHTDHAALLVEVVR